MGHVFRAFPSDPMRCLVFLLSYVLACCPAFAADAPSPEAARFDILEYVIEGNSVLDNLDIERAVYPYLGPQRSIDDVELAREKLERAYQDQGFLTVLVEIPEQKVAGGVVRLKVTEGSVERLRIVGSRYFSLGEIRARTPSVAKGEVPNFPQLQAELATLSNMPDRRITPLMRAGKAPGTVEVELKVEDELPLHGSVELNNKQSPDTSNRRIEASLRYDNLWQKGHSLGLSFVNSPLDRDEVNVLSANYLMPVGERGRQLAIYAVSSDSDVFNPLGGGQSLGKGIGAGLRLVLPLPARGNWFHSFTAGIDRKDFEQTASETRKRIVYWPLSAQYGATYFGERTELQASLSTTLGVRPLNKRQVACEGLSESIDQFDCMRSGARADFSVFRADLQGRWRFAGQWSLEGRIDGQYAGGPLVSYEQYSAGGVDSVRGYLDSEVVADDGLRARVELTTPDVLPLDRWSFRALLFWDWARLRRQQPLACEADRYRLASVGVGLRFAYTSALSVGVQLGAGSCHG